jgi:acyl carrier protein
LNQIDERLQGIAREVFNDDSLVLTDSTKPAEVLGWDSLGHVNFVLSVENEFGVEFSEDEFVRFKDVGGLKRMLGEKLVNPSLVSGASGEPQGTTAS